MKDIDLSKLQVNRLKTFSLQHTGGVRLRWWQMAAGVAGLLVLYLLVFPPSVEVQTTQVVSAYPSQQFVVLNSTGYVVARRKAAVASKGTGRLEWLGVTEGSQVKEGTLIAKLESRDVEASLQNASANTAVAAASLVSANAELSDAETNFHRLQPLYKKHYVSQVMFDDARSRYSRAKASVSSAQAALQAAKANEAYAENAVEYTRIKAPFDGVVISKSANVGDIVTPMSSAADSKGAVVVMADMSTLEVNADVSESSLASVRVDQPCEIILDAFPEKRFRGQVSAIVPTVNRSSATVTTKVRILDADPRILPDMSAKVSFLSRAVNLAEEHPMPAVNPDAIAQRDDKSVVYTVGHDGKAHEVDVTLGPRLGEVQGLSGVQTGTTLVLRPAKRLHDGSSIKLAEAK